MGEKEPFSILQLLIGLLAGLLAGAVCSFFIYGFSLPVFGKPHLAFLAPFLNAAVLVGLGIFVVKTSHDRGFSRGMAISLALVLILSTTCGVMLIRTS